MAEPVPKTGAKKTLTPEDNLVVFADWPFVGNDAEPLVAGNVQSGTQTNFEGYTIEMINIESQPQWRSGRISLPANGAFMTQLYADKSRSNRYSVELCDPKGALLRVSTEPDSLTYVLGNVMAAPPLTHSVGAGLANDEVEWLLKKGTPLTPARGRSILRTTRDLRPGQPGDVIRIPIVEGDNPRASRNRRIGHLEVTAEAEQVRRTVPQGSEVEFTIEIDSSRQVTAQAYIPLLDEDFKTVLHLIMERTGPETLRKEVEKTKERLQRTQETANQTNSNEASSALTVVESEQMEQQLDNFLNAANADPDAVDKAEKKLLDLNVALDKVENLLEWPVLVKDAEDCLKDAPSWIDQYGNAEDRRNLASCETALRSALSTKDPDLLRLRLGELKGFLRRVLDRKGIVQAWYFEDLKKLVDEMSNPTAARDLIARGQQALNSEDIQALRAINQQLRQLLPSPPPEPDVSTVMR
ncbi:MAG: hypothetical protein ACRERU_04800 [Methylococcales bacterium]